jgi:hypothetical protein
MMHEYVTNLHMHTPYSDGHGSHPEIVNAALAAGLDAAIVTDHNVYVDGPQNIYKNGNQRLLMVIGEEVHDQSRQPQKNHLLVVGANRELAHLAYDTQKLLDAVKQAGGISYLAHPVDPAAPVFNEPDLSWVDWDAQGYTGIELWNGMSEFKSLLKSRLHAIYYALNPRRVARGPFPDTLKLWDNLLAEGKRVAAIGGSDAHAFPARLGPFKRTLFPYAFHFGCINTHIFTPKPFVGDLEEDSRLVLEALARGHAFIGYDLPVPTKGFRFTASGKDSVAWMGDVISAAQGITIQIRLPRPTECRLIKDGKVVKIWNKRENCTHITSETGTYRVEAYIPYMGQQRGWIFSNPIYVRE